MSRDNLVESAPFGAYAPSGLLKLTLARDAPVLDELAGQARRLPGARPGDAGPARPAGRRRLARRAHAPLPLQQQRREAAVVHAAIFRSARAGVSRRAAEGRLRLSRRRRQRRRLRAGDRRDRRAARAHPRRRAAAGLVRAARLQHRPERLRQRQGGVLRLGRRRRRGDAVRQHPQSGRVFGPDRQRRGARRADPGARQDAADAWRAKRATRRSTRSNSTSKVRRIWCSIRF